MISIAWQHHQKITKYVLPYWVWHQSYGVIDISVSCRVLCHITLQCEHKIGKERLSILLIKISINCTTTIIENNSTFLPGLFAIQIISLYGNMHSARPRYELVPWEGGVYARLIFLGAVSCPKTESEVVSAERPDR